MLKCTFTNLWDVIKFVTFYQKSSKPKTYELEKL